MKPTLAKNKVLRPKLKQGQRVIIIGLGGVGSIVARYGAVFLASMHEDCYLMLVDGDKFEPSNASRMLFGRHGNKASVIRRELLPRFKDSRVSLTWYNQYLTNRNRSEERRVGKEC